MDDATITSKSQLTLPKAVREALKVVPGDKIRFVPSRDGFRIVAIKAGVKGLYGAFQGRRKTALSIPAMNRTIADMGNHEEPAD